jgi:hypothetical protein
MLTTFVCKIRGAVWCGCKTCNVKLLKKLRLISKESRTSQSGAATMIMFHVELLLMSD